jgi:anoctamin-10
VEVGFFIVFLTFFTSWLMIPAVPGIVLGIYIMVYNDQDS